MILLVVTIGVFSGVFFGYQYIKNKQEQIFIEANAQAKTLVIDNILKFKEKSFLGPVNDYSCWDEMINYVNRPTRRWEEVNLTTLEAFGVSYTWIYSKDYKLIYSTFDTVFFCQNEEIEIGDDDINVLFNESGVCHFYMSVRDTIFEITGGTIVPSFDTEHETTPQGYFFVGKFWSDDYIKEMESEMDFSIRFRSLNDTLNLISDKSKINVTKVFKDAHGNDLMYVDFESKNQLVSDFSNTDKLSYALIALLIVTIIVFFIAVRYWITLPLEYVNKSLSSENESYVSRLENQKNEFGEIAKLIKKFFEQKIQLEIEVAERIESQKMIDELYKNTVNLNHELQASEEELRQNLDVTIELNTVLSKQQKEITDSINYAGRIQAALLPPDESLKKLNRDYFILYKPRSIVSGDFYWITKVENKTFIAVADCTGHGVPGGFMSMLGMAYLTEIVSQFQKNSAGEILSKLRKRVIDSLHQTGKTGESKDGMDISLCIIDFDNLKLQFAAAYNPLYILRYSFALEEQGNKEFIEIKGDRMPIGYSPKYNVDFNNHEVELKKNDMMYLFTDGFQDQMSGKTMQKFKRNKLKELLLGIFNEPLEEQKNILDITFEGYRDDYPQVDDVLVFGLKV